MTQEKFCDSLNEGNQDAPIFYASLSKEVFDAEIEKSIQSVKEGIGFSAEEIAIEMCKDYNVRIFHS